MNFGLVNLHKKGKTLSEKPLSRFTLKSKSVTLTSYCRDYENIKIAAWSTPDWSSLLCKDGPPSTKEAHKRDTPGKGYNDIRDVKGHFVRRLFDFWVLIRIRRRFIWKSMESDTMRWKLRSVPTGVENNGILI